MTQLKQNVTLSADFNSVNQFTETTQVTQEDEPVSAEMPSSVAFLLFSLSFVISKT